MLSQLAEKYNLTGQYKKAIESCDKILKDGIKYKPAYNNLFYAYDLLEDFDNVLKVLKNYLESFHLVKEPELQIHSFSLWAERYFKEKREILPLYALSLPFSRPLEVIDINFSTSFHFSRIGWSERSIEALKLILEFYPQDVDILNALSYSHTSKGQYSEAKESLDKAFSITKKNFMTHLLLGNLYRKTSKYKEAEVEYNRLIQHQNSNKFSVYGLYQIQTNITKDNAKDVMNLISAFTGLGLLYIETGEYEQAIEQFSKVLIFYRGGQLFLIFKDPFLTTIYYNIGIAYHALDFNKLALKNFKKALRNDPMSVDVLPSLGELYFEMKKYKHAIKTFQHVVEVKPESYLAWHLLSKSHYKNGEMDNATETNAMCLSLNPKFEPALKLREELGEIQRRDDK